MNMSPPSTNISISSSARSARRRRRLPCASPIPAVAPPAPPPAPPFAPPLPPAPPTNPPVHPTKEAPCKNLLAVWSTKVTVALHDRRHTSPSPSPPASPLGPLAAVAACSARCPIHSHTNTSFCRFLSLRYSSGRSRASHLDRRSRMNE